MSERPAGSADEILASPQGPLHKVADKHSGRAWKSRFPSQPSRLFLLVVDDSAEFRPALRWACRRAKRTGAGIVLLYVIEPGPTHPLLFVEQAMREEWRTSAEARLEIVADDIEAAYGFRPLTLVEQGGKREALMRVIETEERISIVVLGAARGMDGPGPLVSWLTGQKSGDFPVPILIVPGGLTDEKIDALT